MYCLYAGTQHLRHNFEPTVLQPGQTSTVQFMFFAREPVVYRELIEFEFNSLTREAVEIRAQGILFKVLFLLILSTYVNYETSIVQLDFICELLKHEFTRIVFICSFFAQLDVLNAKQKVVDFGALRVRRPREAHVTIANNSLAPLDFKLTLNAQSPVLQEALAKTTPTLPGAEIAAALAGPTGARFNEYGPVDDQHIYSQTFRQVAQLSPVGATVAILPDGEAEETRPRKREGACVLDASDAERAALTESWRTEEDRTLTRAEHTNPSIHRRGFKLILNIVK